MTQKIRTLFKNAHSDILGYIRWSPLSRGEAFPGGTADTPAFKQ